jgi:putative ABC transport system permease protein
MAKESLVGNKLRSMLSILGIIIGIFSIVVVYAMVHSLEKNLNDSFSGFGKDVVFVQKWPWDQMGENYPWWKYLSRPQSSPEEGVFVEENINPKFASGVAFSYQLNTKVEYKNNALTDVTLRCVSYGYNVVQKVNIENGRYFSLQESLGGRNVAIIGYKVAENLFPNIDPIGKQIRIQDRPCIVIGVCAAEGQSLINLGPDEQIFVPVRYAMGFSNYREGEKGCQVLVKANPESNLDDLTFEVTELLKRYRRLKPNADLNFAVNRMSMVTSLITTFFSSVKSIGLIIGGFAMIVGCFGVANIMFVSVKERTQEIGIQKALGAKKTFILVQFLFESILLCIIGGLIGMFLVWLTLQAGNFMLSYTDFKALRMFLSKEDIWLGIIVSVSVGLVAGFLPASTAARLNPVDAMRYK